MCHCGPRQDRGCVFPSLNAIFLQLLRHPLFLKAHNCSILGCLFGGRMRPSYLGGSWGRSIPHKGYTGTHRTSNGPQNSLDGIRGTVARLPDQSQSAQHSTGRLVAASRAPYFGCDGTQLLSRTNSDTPLGGKAALRQVQPGGSPFSGSQTRSLSNGLRRLYEILQCIFKSIALATNGKDGKISHKNSPT